MLPKYSGPAIKLYSNIESSKRMGDENGRMACNGFMLIEFMIVIAVIGILAAIAIPNYINNRRKAEIASVVSDYKYFEKGFIAFAIDEGDYLNDSHIVLPDLPTMEYYINSDVLGKTTLLVGTNNWEGPDSYPCAGISIFELTAPQEDLELLDIMLDDSDLTQGKFFKLSMLGTHSSYKNEV